MIRFAILCYTMLVLFLALIIGPSVIGKNVDIDIQGMLPDLPFRLIQPAGLDHDNTNGTTMLTGTGAESYTGYLYQSRLSASSASEADSRPTDRIRLF